MTDTRNIDFDPALFGDKRTEFPEVPLMAPAAPRRRRWPWILALTLGVGVIAAAGTVAMVPQTKNLDRFLAHAPVLARDDDPPHATPLPLISSEPRRLVSDSAIACDGSETICAEVKTRNPADAVHKLLAAASALPAGRYSVRLSIAPIEEASSEPATQP